MQQYDLIAETAEHAAGNRADAALARVMSGPAYTTYRDTTEQMNRIAAEYDGYPETEVPAHVMELYNAADLANCAAFLRMRDECRAGGLSITTVRDLAIAEAVVLAAKPVR